ncbi:hypothetical protein Acsp04_24070 [Actinomadura sp. NBRC 104425]|nr:hypothetical protein Acsp04_24070 [Actinomadura sp. NBRC 104425]
MRGTWRNSASGSLSLDKRRSGRRSRPGLPSIMTPGAEEPQGSVPGADHLIREDDNRTRSVTHFGHVSSSEHPPNELVQPLIYLVTIRDRPRQGGPAGGAAGGPAGRRANVRITSL